MQSSATAELQQLLTIAPTNFQGANNPHAVAHAALQALRESGDERYLFLRSILELESSPDQEELLFHCVTGTRHVLLHKWSTWSNLFRQTLRDFLMTMGQQPALPRTVRLACYNTSASFWKRQWNDDENSSNNQLQRPEEQALVEAMLHKLPNMPRLNNPQELFHYIDSLLKTESASASAASFLSIFLGEFMGKSAVSYNLPLEFHKQAHASFENGWLETCLKLSMGSLSQVVSMITPEVGLSLAQEELTLAILQVTIDVISWDFGADAWDAGVKSNKILVRPPISWRDILVQPDFCRAIFGVHDIVATRNPKLAQSLRQLLLLLASLSGPMFADESQKLPFVAHLVEGTLKLLSSSELPEKQQQDSTALLDALSLVSRLIVNFKLSLLVKLPTLVPLLTAITSTGSALLHANVRECERVGGDIESMEHGEWREECLTILLDGTVLLCGDLEYISTLCKGTPESRQVAQVALSNSLVPLYTSYITCRTRMARLEEYYLTSRSIDLDEVREEISAVGLTEEMASAAAIGRLNLPVSLACLSSLLKPTLHNLNASWDNATSRGGTAEDDALLEECRILVMCVGHLLTDDNEGETPMIPETIASACQGETDITNAIVSMVQSVLNLAEIQAGKIVSQPSNPHLSPFLANSLLWLLDRWAPAYVLPAEYGVIDGTKSNILQVWSGADSAQAVISFCTTLCLHYHCYWPLEPQVQQGSCALLLSLAKRGKQMRKLMISSVGFQQLIVLHSITANMRHNASQSELEAALISKGSAAPPALLFRGYQRLPYLTKSRILTALLVASSEREDSAATVMFDECLSAVQVAFSSLVQALVSKQVSPDDANAQEMACLCVEMYGGVARASEMSEPERIPPFITQSLPHLSGLMVYYAHDLTICESLLRLFRDYSEQFIAMLNREECLALFTASAELLKSYSTQHACSSRVILTRLTVDDPSIEADAEEEQSYNDVLCAIQLLIHLGTKDFIDTCSSTQAAAVGAVDSSQVTDVIFFGLSQIIPLMTRGLLQFPTLCTQYFSLVGFMMDTYPEKVCVLPYELFSALLESLLFGMSHSDLFVAKSSFHGIGGIAREHLKTKCLDGHLSQQNADIFDNCSRRLLQEIVFHPTLIWDRLEPAGMCLLPLAAVDIHRFAAVVNVLSQQVCPPEHQTRLHASFQSLIQPEVLAKVASGGYEGRMNRIRFKKDFSEFVKSIHSFLVLK